MVKGEEYLYWMTNTEWYDYYDKDNPYLTDEAPANARDSFEKYLNLKKKEKESEIRII